jgi:hypothetical protein
MGLVLRHQALGGRRERDVDAVGALFHVVDWHRVALEARRALAGDHAVLPAVPRAHHELLAQAPVAQRTALVVADVRDDAEAALVQEDGDLMTLDPGGERDASEQLVPAAEPVPLGHGALR